MYISPVSNNNITVSGIKSFSSSAKYYSVLQADTFTRTQDNKEVQEKTQNPIERRAYIPTKEYSETISSLYSLQAKAEETFQKQQDTMGWCSKISDKLSTLWCSKNRSNVVLEDIQQSRHQIENLQEAAYKGNFRNEFFKTFGVNYDKEAIEAFEKEAQHYSLIQTSSQMAETAKTELQKHIDFFKENADSINPESNIFNRNKKHPDIAGKMEEYKADLAKYVGGKDNLQKLAQLKRPDFIQLSREEQIEIYDEIAESTIYNYEQITNNLKDGKTDKEIQKGYDEAYKKAFGTKNNIQKRVNDYVRAQQIQTVAVEDMAVAGFIGAAIAITGTTAPALLGAGITAASYTALDITELATNKVDNSEDLTKENIKDIVKCSLISGAEYFAGSKLYDIIPESRTGKRIVDTSLNVARTLGIELSTAFVGEYLRTGEWATDQMDPKTFASLALSTFATEELVRMGISSSKDYSPKSSKMTEKIMETVSKAANKELEKQFKANPMKVLNLKLLSIQNPDLFKELIASAL